MNVSVKTVLKTTLTAAAMSFAMANSASANTWVGTDNVLGAGETISNIDVNDDTALGGWLGSWPLNNDAWGMIGHWYAFQLTDMATTTVNARARDTTAQAPAFTLYRTDMEWVPFGSDQTTPLNQTHVPGQTEGYPPHPSGAIHDMSQVAQAGQNGIVWATQAVAGGPGIVETLGYANSGLSAASNSWGQAVNYGVNDVSIDNLYESGIAGSVGQGSASLTLNNLKAGWYTIFVGGANTSLDGSPIDVTVSSVPVPGAVWLFGSALVGLVGASRRKLIA
ncbi:MAG: hypothetical protein LUQ11_03795 [Methylococcaceae bacterium]|nr:hypothetical protein [Methylococcaceae bacterium]